jgi:hypothetical protein
MIEWHEDTEPRWAGKIRAGSRDEKTKKLNNTEHFMLHDVPELIPALGENPTEIFFTVYSDDMETFFPRDLRFYSASELICVSRHREPDPETGRSMGTVAAYFRTEDAPGVTNQPFPGRKRARVRRCSKACPDLVAGNCSEHFFLRMMIPHYSMGAIYVLDNTSFLGMLNLQSAFKLASYRLDGKLAGEIFRLYKRKEEGHYDKGNGQRGKTEVNVVAVEHVKFEEYEKLYKAKTDPIDWAKLVSARKRSVALVQPTLPMPDDVELLDVASERVPLQVAAPETSLEDAIKARANDPAVMKLFGEIAHLLGKENTEELRIKTAGDSRIHPSVDGLITYLQGRIKETKKAQKAKEVAGAKAAPAPQAPPPPKAAAGAVEEPLF